MPYSLRRSLLPAGVLLLLLSPHDTLADPAARTKSPRAQSVSLPSDPALLTPAQRLKLALPPIPAAPVAPVPAAVDQARRERGVFAAPVQVSAADRAILEARQKAKLEANRAPQRRDGAKRTAVKDQANLPQSTILTGPPGLTPAEQAKAEAAGVLAPARKEAQP